MYIGNVHCCNWLIMWKHHESKQRSNHAKSITTIIIMWRSNFKGPSCRQDIKAGRKKYLWTLKEVKGSCGSEKNSLTMRKRGGIRKYKLLYKDRDILTGKQAVKYFADSFGKDGNRSSETAWDSGETAKCRIKWNTWGVARIDYLHWTRNGDFKTEDEKVTTSDRIFNEMNL